MPFCLSPQSGVHLDTATRQRVARRSARLLIVRPRARTVPAHGQESCAPVAVSRTLLTASEKPQAIHLLPNWIPNHKLHRISDADLPTRRGPGCDQDYDLVLQPRVCVMRSGAWRSPASPVSPERMTQ